MFLLQQHGPQHVAVFTGAETGRSKRGCIIITSPVRACNYSNSRRDVDVDVGDGSAAYFLSASACNGQRCIGRRMKTGAAHAWASCLFAPGLADCWSIWDARPPSSCVAWDKRRTQHITDETQESKLLSFAYPRITGAVVNESTSTSCSRDA